MKEDVFKRAESIQKRLGELREEITCVESAYKMLKNVDHPTPVQIQQFLDRLCDDKHWSVEVLGALLGERIQKLLDAIHDLQVEFMEL